MSNGMSKERYPLTYAAWTKDDELRFNSTSGGIFSEISKQIIKAGGYVCAARYNEDNVVEHYIVNDMDGLVCLRQSKYTQSDLGNIYSEVKDLLNKNNFVLFCGAPCQIAGLRSFLYKKYGKLVCVDFICRGVNSPKAYRSWLKEIEKIEGSKVTRVWFKYKDGGWKSSPKRTRIDFLDGRTKVYDQEDNLFMKGYLESNLYIRQSCCCCQFKGLPRMGDITLADFWGIDKYYDTDQGTSLVLVNSKKGEKIWNLCNENIQSYRQDFASLLSSNPMFDKSAEYNHEESRFLRRVNEDNFSELVIKYTQKSIFKKLKKKMNISDEKYLNDKSNELVKNIEYNGVHDKGEQCESQVPTLYRYKKNCMGCTACFSVCPKDAIEMDEDIEGFKYPIIDAKKCIRCGLCLKACPIKNTSKEIDKEIG